MPVGLMDMFRPSGGYYGVGGTQDPQMDFGGALAQRQNSLIGMGLGLLSPMGPGSNAWSNALGGYTAGSRTDAQNAHLASQMAHQKTQDARQAAMDRFNMGLREREFAQSQLTPYQKMQSDIERAKGTPNEQQVADFYRNQLDAGPPKEREVFDPTLGRNVVQEWDSRSKQYKTATTGGGGSADPFTTGTGTSTGAPAATSTQGQPVLPARKPLAAHEQTAIDDADKAVMANRNAISNLQYAKELSKKAASGPFALERGQFGSQLGGMFGEGGKETVMLHNTIINNAVDQLKAAFGGNPSEGERKILLEMAGSVNSSDDVRQEIYERGIRLAKEKLDFNQKRARGIRSGTYYQPGADTTGAAPQSSGAVRRYNPATGNIE